MASGPVRSGVTPRRKACLALATEHDVVVCFNARELELLHRGSIRASNVSQRWGPDLLDPQANHHAILQRAWEILEPDARLVDLLLDQRVAAGMGNVYKSAVLFLARQAPLAPFGQVDDALVPRLYRTAAQLLQRNLRRGPRTTRFAADGRSRLWVYGKRPEPCLRRGAAIRYGRCGQVLRPTY
jgi:endonuclease-8